MRRTLTSFIPWKLRPRMRGCERLAMRPGRVDWVGGLLTIFVTFFLCQFLDLCSRLLSVSFESLDEQGFVSRFEEQIIPELSR